MMLNIKVIVKSLNLISVGVILCTLLYSGIFLKREILNPVNIESKIVLFSLSLAGATGVIDFILQQQKSTSAQMVLLAVFLGVIIFFVMIVLSLLYLKNR